MPAYVSRLIAGCALSLVSGPTSLMEEREYRCIAVADNAIVRTFNDKGRISGEPLVPVSLYPQDSDKFAGGVFVHCSRP